MPTANRRDSEGRRTTRLKTTAKDRFELLPGRERLEALLRDRYRLTPSESQVASHLADGLRYSEIAEILGVSYHTVHSHVKAIHTKTGVPSNGRLMVLLRNDLRL